MPITGPSPNSRHKILARNQSIIISISKIVPLDKHGQLEFTIQINNESSSVIPSIGFTLIETSHIKSVDISPLTIGIGQSSSIMHSFVISVDNPYLAQAAKLIIVPNGGGVDSLETRIVVFPSYFLVPSDESSLDTFIEKCTFSSEVTYNVSMEARNVLQKFANIFQATIINSE
ncbi:Adaptin N terminal region family protein [Histomonas meleagridis]|uniref:Adaptin N terminal region family protein n=1 Tax=Histomonas meleagridis TaxID=135588 RepID=UPI00355979C7|nr:Adaptin N terminal region family protein [Histomonas meleagridis]KAH0806109.1 Adaptin N terminal region family protein [Histomonas meleagridis]